MMRQTDSKHAAPAPHGGGALFDHLLFSILLVLLGVRPMIAEVFERSELTFLADATATVAAPTPATTAWLDFATLTAALVVFARRSGGRRWRWYWVAMALVTLAVLISSLAAGEQRVALNAGMNLVVILLAGGALLRVMRAPWMPRVLISVVLATGVTSALHCAAQKYVYQEQTEIQWREIKAQLIEQGRDPNDPMLVNYERRLASAQPNGFLSHPNTTASLLSMWILAAAGLGVSLMRGNQTSRSTRPLALALLCGALVLMLLALWLTGSAGAAAGLAAGAALLGAIGLWSGFGARRVAGVTIVLTAAYVALIVGGAAYGIVKGTLPRSSLAFRWNYWTAAARAYAEHPLTGLGRENFHDAYMRHRPMESTEVVRNAHNLWVTALAELGPLGLCGLALLAVGTLVALLRRLAQPDEPAGAGGQPGRLMPGVIAASILTLQLILSGTAGSGIASGALWSVMVLWLTEIAAVWIVVFAACNRLLSNDVTTGRWSASGCVAAFGAVLVHNLVGFSLCRPAGLSALVLLVVWGLASPTPVAARQQLFRRAWGRHRAIAMAVMILASAWHLWAIAIPTARTTYGLSRLRAALHAARSLADVETAASAALRTVLADEWDADLPRAVAREYARVAAANGLTPQRRLTWCAIARDMASIALQRNPASHATYRLQARLADQFAETCRGLWEEQEVARELIAACSYWESATRLHPTDPRTRIDAAAAQMRVWRNLGRRDSGERALQHLIAALKIDATRPPEEVLRLRPAELRQIDAYMKELREAGINGETADLPGEP